MAIYVVHDLFCTAVFVLAAGIAEGFALLGFEHLVDAQFGDVHLAADGHLQLGLALKKGKEFATLVTLALHEHAYRVAHSTLLLAQGIDTLSRIFADGFHFAFLHGIEILHYLGHFVLLLGMPFQPGR